MALLLDVTQPNGVVTNYNRITAVYYQPKGSLQIELGAYLDAAARLSGASPVISQIVPLDVTSIDPTQSILEQAYSLLKEGVLQGATNS